MADYVNISPELVEAQWNELRDEKTAFKPKIDFNEKNYLNLRIDPGKTEKTVTVRILPVSATDGHPFFTIHTHSVKVSTDIAKSGFKTYLCLNDPSVNGGDENVKCPLCEKSKQLYKESDACDPNDNLKSELFKMAGSFRSKRTYIVRVIERGHEDEGVKFWRFNEHRNGDGFHDQLMELYKIRNNESIAAGQGPFNIFDLKNGKDIVITSKYDANRKTVHTINDAGFPTPLSRDENQIVEWVNDPKTWKDLYASKSAEYLQLIADGEVPFFDKESGKWRPKDAKPEASADKDYNLDTTLPDDGFKPVEPVPSQYDDDMPF